MVMVHNSACQGSFSARMKKSHISIRGWLQDHLLLFSTLIYSNNFSLHVFGGCRQRFNENKYVFGCVCVCAYVYVSACGCGWVRERERGGLLSVAKTDDYHQMLVGCQPENFAGFKNYRGQQQKFGNQTKHSLNFFFIISPFL